MSTRRIRTFSGLRLTAGRGGSVGSEWKADSYFDGETQTIPDMVKLATFYDPDGNALMLYQDLQK